jgi:hypothetical protein
MNLSFIDIVKVATCSGGIGVVNHCGFVVVNKLLQFEGKANASNDHEGDARGMLVAHHMNDKL